MQQVSWIVHCKVENENFCSTGGKDFDDNPIMLMMEPSELPQEDYSITVSVVADEINEAVESFLLIMRVEDAVQHESVDLTIRNTTRCIIRDDDRKNYSLIIIK